MLSALVAGTRNPVSGIEGMSDSNEDRAWRGLSTGADGPFNHLWGEMKAHAQAHLR